MAALKKKFINNDSLLDFWCHLAGKLLHRNHGVNMSYVVQTGDTIAAVTRRLNCSFRELKQSNPKSLGRTKDGRWFLKEGATVGGPGEVASRSHGTASVGAGSSGQTYEVATGETVRQVCRKLGQPFALLRSLNPEAVGRTKDGRWFFKAGAKITSSATFDQTLDQAAGKTDQTRAMAPALAAPPVSAAETRSTEQTAAPPAKILTSRAMSATASNRAARDQNRPTVEAAPVSDSVTPKPLPRTDVSRPDPEPTLAARFEEVVKTIAPDVEVAKSFASGDISQPYQGTMEESLRYKAALSPSLDLTLGLVKEHHRQEDILAGVSDSPVDRAVTMGLRFKF